MTDDEDLAGLDPYDRMEAERARLEHHFATLDDTAWQQPSRCEGWSVRDVLAHLTASEDYNRACLDGTVSEFLGRMGARGVTDMNGLNELGIRDFDDVATASVLEAWSTRASTNHADFRRADGGDVDSSVGAYPARWQAWHLAFELAVHADDVGVPVEAGEEPDRTEWQAAFGRFALKEMKPGVRTEAGAGRTRVQADGVDVELPNDEFVQAVSGRAGAVALDPDTRSFLAVT
jgi:uncharacterized protein (TIGR03083 family)